MPLQFISRTSSGSSVGTFVAFSVSSFNAVLQSQNTRDRDSADTTCAANERATRLSGARHIVYSSKSENIKQPDELKIVPYLGIDRYFRTSNQALMLTVSQTQVTVVPHPECSSPSSMVSNNKQTHHPCHFPSNGKFKALRPKVDSTRPEHNLSHALPSAVRTIRTRHARLLHSGQQCVLTRKTAVLLHAAAR
jgi:hypothetical protein